MKQIKNGYSQQQKLIKIKRFVIIIYILVNHVKKNQILLQMKRRLNKNKDYKKTKRKRKRKRKTKKKTDIFIFLHLIQWRNVLF